MHTMCVRSTRPLMWHLCPSFQVLAQAESIRAQNEAVAKLHEVQDTARTAQARAEAAEQLKVGTVRRLAERWMGKATPAWPRRALTHVPSE